MCCDRSNVRGYRNVTQHAGTALLSFRLTRGRRISLIVLSTSLRSSTPCDEYCARARSCSARRSGSTNGACAALLFEAIALLDDARMLPPAFTIVRNGIALFILLLLLLLLMMLLLLLLLLLLLTLTLKFLNGWNTSAKIQRVSVDARPNARWRAHRSPHHLAAQWVAPSKPT